MGPKKKSKTVSFSKSYLFSDYNTKETCKNKNHSDKNNTKTNINKKNTVKIQNSQHDEKEKGENL